MAMIVGVTAEQSLNATFDSFFLILIGMKIEIMFNIIREILEFGIGETMF